jgi:hypothetical protein
MTFSVTVVSAQSTAWTYQGYLEIVGVPVNDTCDFQFAIYDVAVDGAALASQTVNDLAVADGVFTATLDFGASVYDDTRYLDIQVQCSGDPSFVTLTPRQIITASPYSIRSLNAESVPWDGLTGVPAGFADNVDDGVIFTRTIVVNPVDSTIQNGDALRAAITAANAAPQRFQVLLEPGIYETGTTPIVVGNVHVRGSGVNFTRIFGEVPGIADGGVFVLQNGAQLSDLSVSNTNDDSVVGIRLAPIDFAVSTLTDVNVFALSITQSAHGIVVDAGANLALDTVTVSGSGNSDSDSVWMNGGNMTARGLTAFNRLRVTQNGTYVPGAFVSYSYLQTEALLTAGTVQFAYTQFFAVPTVTGGVVSCSVSVFGPLTLSYAGCQTS